MKNTILFSIQLAVHTIVALVFLQTATAQSVGIGTASPNPSARLEINSTSQGILIPTLTSTQRSSISNPATGLLVFQTNGTKGFYYFDGTFWKNLTLGTEPNNDGIAFSSLYGLTSTFAGTGVVGPDDGIGAAASFQQPEGIAVDASGNIYVTDKLNHKVRKITPAGVVSTIAGSGLAGYINADGSNAYFNHPSAIAVDAAGILYVADKFNNVIRMITPGGVVSTFAGTGGTGAFNDGPVASAKFDHPAGVAVDRSGNVYVADLNNHRIRKIAGGWVSTLAGDGNQGFKDGTGTGASFNVPYGIAVDAAGFIYVADMLNSRIRKITPDGVVTTLAGNGDFVSVDGQGASASLGQPTGVAVDRYGNVYFADAGSSQIRKITPDGWVTTLAGSGLVGKINDIGTAASFDLPQGVAVNTTGIVFVADTHNNLIRKIIAY